MQKRYILATVGILIAFAVGLVGFFLVSNGLPDGLDKTMEKTGTSGSEPVYTAPLDYGGDYMSSLLMGVIGFFVTLATMLGILKLRKSMKASNTED
jgi:hypothetical protein